ncbi:MAG: P-II family nitrogen regulator [Lachnospiraceae bacterium]|nr:P-II family nitrogen regulator [Lachnospiraceae bacterium]
MGLTKIEIVTSLVKIDSLQKVLGKLGVTGMTVYQAMGCGTQYGAKEYEVEEKNETPALLPKQMVMVVVDDAVVPKVVDAVEKELYTGHIGDGKIFVSPVSNVIRVRTGEEGLDALK